MKWHQSDVQIVFEMFPNVLKNAKENTFPSGCNANSFATLIVLSAGLESREYGRTEPSRWPRGTPYPQKLALTSTTSGGRSVGIVRSRTQATEFSF
jgi:hypothetical protein